MKRLKKLMLLGLLLLGVTGCGLREQQQTPEETIDIVENQEQQEESIIQEDQVLSNQSSQLVIAMNTTKTLNPPKILGSTLPTTP